MSAIFDPRFSPLLPSAFPSSSVEGQASQTPDPTPFIPHDRGRPGRPEVPVPGQGFTSGFSDEVKGTASPCPTASRHGARLASLPALPGWLWRPTTPTPRTAAEGDAGDRSSAEPTRAALWARGHAFKPRSGGLCGSTAKPLGSDRTSGCRPRPPGMEAREECRPYALPRGPGTKATVPPG